MPDNGILENDSYIVGTFMYLFKYSPMKMKEMLWEELQIDINHN